MKFQNKLKSLPQKPGAYLFKNKKGEVIYVGKATTLKSRMKSYWQKSQTLSPWKKIMIDEIADFEYILTSTEKEALFLEANLIKKYHPKFNVIFTDDKNFLYIKISHEDFPLIYTVRRVLKDKTRYFGPYTSANSARYTLNLLRKIFPYRTCQNLPKKACLEYHLNRCPAPCEGKISKNEYAKLINQIIKFLKGDYSELQKNLKEEMKNQAKNILFEKAAQTRDKLFALENVMAKQKVIYPENLNQDVISLVQNKIAAVNLFQIRAGKLIDRKNFILKIENQEKKEILESFLNQYYAQTPDYPDEIIIPEKTENQKELENLTQAKVIIAQKGKKRELIKLGEENARDFLEKKEFFWQKEDKKAATALKELAKEIKLKSPPKRIEAYDISNIQGLLAVGSMVVFENGQPKKSDYRKFKIKTVFQANDPAMMAEVIKRRFSHQNLTLPNLIMLDGGKGQLSIVLKTLKGLKIKIPTVALAKKHENLYLPNKKTPIQLSQNASFLLQRIRDEAHRFAIGFYRSKHKKELKKSVLDEIPGLGPKKKKLLLDKFGSLQNIRQSDNNKLEQIIGKKLTKIIREYL
jgi:excinuclease ABC subunit C